MAAVHHAYGAGAPPRVKVDPPKFKGEQGERPEPHLLKVNDWLEATQVPEAEKSTKFKLTLEGLAREWYDDVTVPANWRTMQTMFGAYYSVQGRSRKQLNDKWRALQFNPGSDNIDDYIREVKSLARQLNIGDQFVLDTLKSSMPPEVYTLLFPIHNLNLLLEMLKDFYAPTNSKGTLGNQASPFNRMVAVEAEEADPGEDPNEAVVEQLNRLTAEVKGIKKTVYKPSVAAEMKKEKAKEVPKERFKKRTEKEAKGDATKPEKSTGWQKGRKYDKSPTVKKPREASKTKDKDGHYRCFGCKQIGHFIRECPDMKEKGSQLSSIQEQMNRMTAYMFPEEEALNKRGASQQAQM